MHAMMLALLLVTALLQSSEASLGSPLSPSGLCSTLLQPAPSPSPAGRGTSNGGNGGFLISADITPNADGTGYEYTPGASYTVTLMATTEAARGFAVQSVSTADGLPLGMFAPAAGSSQQLCPQGANHTVVVFCDPASKDLIRSQALRWRAPPNTAAADARAVDFLYTVEEQKPGNLYPRMSAIAENPPTTAVSMASTSSPVTVAESSAAPPPLPEAPPPGVTVPTRSASDYNLILREPEGCAPNSCTVFVGIDTNQGNSDYLDVYMQGETQAWIAVGFTETPSMFSADVLACNYNPSSSILEALDTWNAGFPFRENSVEKEQDVYLFSGELSDGRITCTIGRPIAGTSDKHSLDLNGDYYILYGRRKKDPAAGRLKSHFPFSPNPSVSGTKYNPTVKTPPNGTTVPTRSPADYAMILRDPEGCEASACTTFVGIDRNQGNPDYLDVYLEGDTQGWIAVGFTKTASMFSADVLACNFNPNSSIVEALNGWNEAAPTRHNTIIDEQDLHLFSGDLKNGRISCTVGRQIAGTGNDKDLDLNGLYYILSGRRERDPYPGLLATHVGVSPDPSISGRQFNPGRPRIPGGVTTPTRKAKDYTLIFSDPEGCEVIACNTFIGIDTNLGNPDYLDIYMEGDTRGWIAVGFTKTPNMFSADVIACNYNPTTSMVEALDTSNAAPPTRHNTVDDKQDVFLFSGELRNGRISCTVGRLISGSTDSRQDVDLNDQYYVLYGTRNRDPSPGYLQSHVNYSPHTPLVSNTTTNPVPPQKLPHGTTRPTTQPDSLPLKFQDPEGCSASKCDLYVGIERNSGNEEYLNFYLEGEASAWVAVGFSKTESMFTAEVFGCAVSTDGRMKVLDTWNVDPPVRNNIPGGVSGETLYLFNATTHNGRISCSFMRSIAGSNDSKSLDLDGDYYVLYGRSSGEIADDGTLKHHQTPGGANLNPQKSGSLVNPANDTGAQKPESFDAIKRILIQSHGILMLVAWPLLASNGIFFASFMRPALPNGEWFQVHRACMISSLVVGAVGFVLIFVSQMRNSIPGLIDFVDANPVQRSKTAHFALGIAVMLLQVVNPIIAIFRCHPKSKNRWIFNIIHGFPGIGTFTEITALVTGGLGFVVFSKEYSRFGDLTLFWVYLGFVIYVFSMFVSMFAISALVKWIKRRSDDHSSDYRIRLNADEEEDEDVEVVMGSWKKNRKEPSSDSPFRWMGLGIFSTVTALVVATLLVLMVLPIE